MKIAFKQLMLLTIAFLTVHVTAFSQTKKPANPQQERSNEKAPQNAKEEKGQSPAAPSKTQDVASQGNNAISTPKPQLEQRLPGNSQTDVIFTPKNQAQKPVVEYKDTNDAATPNPPTSVKFPALGTDPPAANGDTPPVSARKKDKKKS